MYMAYCITFWSAYQSYDGNHWSVVLHTDQSKHPREDIIPASNIDYPVNCKTPTCTFMAVISYDHSQLPSYTERTHRMDINELYQ